ncbi:MAG: hypothetical protein KAU21_09250, partial [Gammaproteobacteria bacterium]|nr:hypothetical protein [Gammaproteobacteria bacterium]
MIFILVLLPALLLAGWSARLYLAEYLTTSSMQQAGLEDITVDIQHLDLKQTRLSQLSFVLPTNTGRLTLKAKDVSISYQPAKLIKGRIDRLEVNTLVVHYARNAEPEESYAEPQQTTPAPEPEAIHKLLTTALEKYILFDDLSIHQVTLNGEAFAALDGKTLSLVSRKNTGALYAELTLLTKTADSPSPTPSQHRPVNLPQLVTTRLSKDALEAELRPAQTSSLKSNVDLPAKIKLELNNKELNGEYQFSPRAMQVWLQAISGKTEIAVVTALSEGPLNENQSSTIKGTVSLNYKNSELWYATLTSAARRLSFKTHSADNIALNIKLAYSATAASPKLKLLDGTTLSANKVNTGVSTFTDSYIKLAGELTNENNRWLYKGAISSKQLTASYQSQQLQL